MNLGDRLDRLGKCPRLVSRRQVARERDEELAFDQRVEQLRGLETCRRGAGKAAERPAVNRAFQLELAAHCVRCAGNLPAQGLPAEPLRHDLVDGVGVIRRLRYEIIWQGHLADVAPRVREQVRQLFLLSGN